MSINHAAIVTFPIPNQLEQFGGWIPDAWFMSLSFLLIVTFYLKEFEKSIFSKCLYLHTKY